MNMRAQVLLQNGRPTSLILLLRRNVPPWCCLGSLSCNMRCIKYRSLPSDDPFGEHSTWENPGDGMFAGWKDVPQDGFAAAVDSDTVRHAHFGPEWARFSTVGKLALQHAVSKPAGSFPSSEQIHDRQVAAKREMLQHHNFQTYDEWLENMLGTRGDELREGEGSTKELLPSPPLSGNLKDDPHPVPSSIFEDAEKEYDELKGPSPEPLPTFMRDIIQQETTTQKIFRRDEVNASGEPSHTSSTLGSPFASELPERSISENKDITVIGEDRKTSEESLAKLSKDARVMPGRKKDTFPSDVLRMVNDHLPSDLGNSMISLQDPYHWSTLDVIHFLTFLTPCEKVDSMPTERKTVMDESMISAFQMAEVTGKMLLDLVQPPTLFRIMRRWHASRKKVAQKAWDAHSCLRSAKHEQGQGDSMSLSGMMSESTATDEMLLELPPLKVIEDCIAEGTPEMESSLEGLSQVLMTEWTATRPVGLTEETMESSPLAIWETINRFYHTTKKVVNIFVGSNCDAAAGSLTLMSLLKSSLLAFSVHPISSYDELREMVRTFQVAQDLSVSKGDDLFILIGIGGALPMNEYFDFTRQIVILLDSHRPFHLQTLRLAAEGGNRLFIWGMSKIQEDVDIFFHRLATQVERKRRRLRQRAVARKHRHLELNDHRKGKGEDYGIDVSGIDDDRILDDVDHDDGMSFLDIEESDSDDNDTEGKEEKGAVTFINWLKPEEVSPSAQNKYAATCGGCKSCALEVYDLSILLNRMNSTFLWHAAVGVCDLYYRSCIDYGTYLVEMRPLHDAVALQNSSSQQRALGQIFAPDELSQSPIGLFSDIPVNTLHTSRETSSNVLRLKSIEQPQIFLLQHISLWSALWNDPVISSALGFYHFETGESKLKLLLAKCGVSLEMAHRPWHELNKQDRDYCIRLIQQELRSLINKTPLVSFCTPNLSLRSISRASGFSREVTAFDVCTLFEGTLAACPTDDVYAFHDDEVEQEAGGMKTGGIEYETQRLRKLAGKLEEFHRRQFWDAHALIDMDPSKKEFNAAVGRTVSLHHLIGDAASALMQPSLVLSTQALHYIQLSDPAKTASALETFQTPFRLNALAKRLLLTLTENRGLARDCHLVRPLLLAAPMPSCSIGRDRTRENDWDGNARTSGMAEELGAAGSSFGIGGDDAEKDEDGITYIMIMCKEGVAGDGLVYIKAAQVFNECVEKEKDFETPPLRTSVLPSCVYVKGRENAMHLAELMHLRSLEM